MSRAGRGPGQGEGGLGLTWAHPPHRPVAPAAPAEHRPSTGTPGGQAQAGVASTRLDKLWLACPSLGPGLGSSQPLGRAIPRGLSFYLPCCGDPSLWTPRMARRWPGVAPGPPQSPCPRLTMGTGPGRAELLWGGDAGREQSTAAPTVLGTEVSPWAWAARIQATGWCKGPNPNPGPLWGLPVSEGWGTQESMRR